jgi:hypothetical protein
MLARDAGAALRLLVAAAALLTPLACGSGEGCESNSDCDDGDECRYCSTGGTGCGDYGDSCGGIFSAPGDAAGTPQGVSEAEPAAFLLDVIEEPD